MPSPDETGYRVGGLVLAAVILFLVCGVFEREVAAEDAGELILRLMRGEKPDTTPPTQDVQPDKLTAGAIHRCRLRYKSFTNPESITYLACQYQPVSDKRLAGLRDLPGDTSRKVAYFTAKLAGRDIQGATYRSWYGLGKVKLCLDTDGDGLLSDEKRFIGEAVRSHRFGRVEHYRFGPIVLKPGGVDSKRRIRFYARTDRRGKLALYPAGYKQGRLRLGAHVFKVAVIDGDFDGRYDGAISPPVTDEQYPGCDLFAIDLDRDGQFRWAKTYLAHSEVSPLTGMVNLGDAYCSIDIAPDGGELGLAKVEPQFGTLDLGGADVRLSLWSDAAHQVLYGPQRTWRVPVGRYTARFMELHQADPAKGTVTFKTRQIGKELSDFEILPGQTLLLKVGPPFSIKTTAMRRREDVRIGLHIEGQAGEEYHLAAKRGKNTVAKPQVKVVDGSGSVIDSGQFEYG
jgi:hypothetical protein